MGFTPLNLYKVRKEQDVGEGRDVFIKPKVGLKVKVYSFPAFNRPVVGYLVGREKAVVYLNKRQGSFVYATIGYTSGWIDLNTTEIEGYEISRNEFGGWLFHETVPTATTTKKSKKKAPIK